MGLQLCSSGIKDGYVVGLSWESCNDGDTGNEYSHIDIVLTVSHIPGTPREDKQTSLEVHAKNYILSLQSDMGRQRKNNPRHTKWPME